MNDQLRNKYDSSWYLSKRLFIDYIRPLLKRLLLAVLCMVVIACTTAASAWLIQPVLDDIFVNKKSIMLYLIPPAILINTMINGVASFYESTIMKRVGQQIVANIQIELYRHLIYADLKFLTQYPSGNLISRFTNDINVLKTTSSEIFTGIIKEFFTLIGLIGIMFYQSFSLAFVILVIFPLAFYPISKLGQRMRKISKNMQEKLGDFTVRLDETFQNIRLIKSYCRENYEISRAKAILDKFLSIYKRAAYVESASSPLMEILGGVAIAAVVFYGGRQVINNETTTGAFFSFITALLLAYKPLKAISKLSTLMQEGLAASKRLFLMLDVEAEVRLNSNQRVSEIRQFDIEFHKVFFSYKADQPTLTGVNLHIKQGQTVALVGGSGVGKTTVLNLLLRLYDSDSGIITIGGANIKDIKLDVLRQNIAFVSQEINLFDDSIMENIRYGNLDASDEEILDASMAAAAYDFIMELPKQYHTQIGQNGVKLSGGEKQRLAIARAVLKNAPILLLDEATSALDSISEKKVQMALDYLKRGKTTIVIAHRLSTIETADVIFVLSDGKVSEYGNHQELLLKSGEYAKLYEQYKTDRTLLEV
ncbi:ABC transporter ATP-binding protein [Candidatus Bandiella euplotis]|uniref:ABC transporter ATP-binding/permease protein n=1 Tax=Candidatus Bandiella euplotis TaxID=1664265 RepID=A0ABZ0UPK8_9RICK|nr:ABC transporter ATP-binding protein [Candidatus Bandiella woodruffii]WPX97186.1 ABC transporter ATP-binding/permease protein [Candidatus Bandiella woodruffii]